MANARTRDFLHELSGSDKFLRATRKSISAARMADDELILRFIAFYLMDHNVVANEYKGGMDELLDDTVEKLNVLELDRFVEIRKHFFQAMDNAFYLFGDNAFRKANYVNKALFLGISRALCDINPQRLREKKKDEIVEQLQKAINGNEESWNEEPRDATIQISKFRDALSMATNDAKNVKLVYDTVKKIIGE